MPIELHSIWIYALQFLPEKPKSVISFASRAPIDDLGSINGYQADARSIKSARENGREMKIPSEPTCSDAVSGPTQYIQPSQRVLQRDPAKKPAGWHWKTRLG